MLSLIETFLSEHSAIFGICHGKRLDDTRYNNFTPFVNPDIEKRVNPAEILPEVKSIIVTGFGHPVPVYASETTAQPFHPLALLSSLGVNADYHTKIKIILRELAAEMQKIHPVKFKVLVDSGTLDERALAVRAGIGFFGKNGTVISKKFGSFFNIGCLLTDIPLKELSCYTPSAGSSLSGSVPSGGTSCCPPNCRLCIDACPGRAIGTDITFNSRRCVSYLTQKDGELTDTEKKAVGNQLYGCDICREVCPFNKDAIRTAAEWVNPDEWLSLPEEELIKKYSHTAMSWRGAGILKRNAKYFRSKIIKGED